MNALPENPLKKLVADGMGMMPISVNAALAWSEWLLECLKTDMGDTAAPASTEAVWASQKTLAARYDMSKPSFTRYLASAMAAGKVRFIKPHDGEREGVTKYNVEDMDAFMTGKRKEGKHEV